VSDDCLLSVMVLDMVTLSLLSSYSLRNVVSDDG